MSFKADQFIIRPVTLHDRQGLLNLIHFERYIHRHLDWLSPIHWIGSSPYMIAEQNDKIAAALACPPDPPEVAWIRLFAVYDPFPVELAWKNLWSAALEELKQFTPQPLVAALPLSSWFCSQLEVSGFEQIDKVIILLWSGEPSPPHDIPLQIKIRKMELTDIEAVVNVDRTAFDTLWQISYSGLQAGLMKSAIATVAEVQSQIVGYQISTGSSTGGHLARLAVLPEFQGQGIGSAIIRDMLAQFGERGARKVSVNTQMGNLASLALYKKTGFQLTGEEYGVYQFTIK